MKINFAVQIIIAVGQGLISYRDYMLGRHVEALFSAGISGMAVGFLLTMILDAYFGKRRNEYEKVRKG